MRRLSNCMTTAAAVLMITAGAASAQNLMKAEVPFAFHIGGQVMEPGTIRVGLQGGNTGSRPVVVRNYAAKRGYIVLPESIGDAPKQWVASGSPTLGFDCSTGACFLAKVWTGQGEAYTLYGPKTKSGEVQLTEIVMTPDRGN